MHTHMRTITPADRLTFTHYTHILTVTAVMTTSAAMITLSDGALVTETRQLAEQDGATA